MLVLAALSTVDSIDATIEEDFKGRGAAIDFAGMCSCRRLGEGIVAREREAG